MELLGEVIDLYPTLSEVAGLPADPATQGVSFTGLLDDRLGSAMRKDALTQTRDGDSLRTERWACMYYPASGKYEQEGFMLYDVEEDPGQHQNLVGNPEFSRIRAKLHKRLLERVKMAR